MALPLSEAGASRSFVKTGWGKLSLQLRMLNEEEPIKMQDAEKQSYFSRLHH